MTVSNVVEQIPGFIGADPEACLKLKQCVVAQQPLREATRKLDGISASLRSMKPPFVKEQSTKGTSLDIDLSAQWGLVFSLVLVPGDNPQSQFKVGKKKKRKMNLVLKEDGSFTLVRDDQKDALPDRQYKLQWFSPEIASQWLDLRKYFRESCKLQPEKAKGIQLGLLQTLLTTAGLDVQLQRQVELYCYSTNAWMSLEAEVVGWKVIDYEPEHTQRKRWADVGDEEDSELLSFDSALEQKTEQNLLEPAADKSSKAQENSELLSLESELEQKTEQNLFEPAVDKSSKAQDLRDEIIVRNTFIHFPVKQCIDRRRSKSCSPPLGC